MVAFSYKSTENLYKGFLRRHKGAFKINYLYFPWYFEFPVDLQFPENKRTAALGKAL